MDIPQPTSAKPELSLVIPCFNEEDNLRPLIAALHTAMAPLEVAYEIIVVDDYSRDNSWAVLKQLAAADSRLRGLRFEANSGQSAALWAGIGAARGRFIATMDADLQNDPRDLPNFLAALKNFDCVCGSRIESRSKGDDLMRILSSRIANGVRNKLSGENISDAGCCYRVFKRECVADLKFFKGIHRFLPTLIKSEGFTVTEIPVRHNPRFSGKSNYGVWNRLFASFYDLLAVRWMKKRMFRYEIAEKIN
jgi:glycosyltransferase involved in cell wall biosynthesis